MSANITVLHPEGAEGTQITLPQNAPTPVKENIENVLIAISDSKHSEFAFNWVMKHFFKSETSLPNKKIILFTSHVEGTDPLFERDLETEDKKDKLRKHNYQVSCALLRKYRADVLKIFPSANVEMVVSRNNEPGHAIVQYVEDFGVDVVFVGSRGLGAMKRVFLGSVGDYCSHHLKCPVMIIKHP